METSDKELFESAISDEPVNEAPETPAEQPQEQPRDEHGRFAKAEQPEAQPEQQPNPQPEPARDEANVPSWRLREEREAREAAERRFNEAQTLWQRQVQELQSRLPKQEPTNPPDIFENPNGFVDHNVRQAVDPVRSEIGQLREFYSRRDAERTHGADKVKAAYSALDQGIASRDPEALAAYHRVMNSMDPYGDMVQWHQQRTVFSQIGSDPQAWFSRELETRLGKDPAFQASLIQQIQKLQQPNPQRQTNIVQLPPSLNRVAAAQGNADDDADMSDQALFRNAMR